MRRPMTRSVLHAERVERRRPAPPSAHTRISTRADGLCLAQLLRRRRPRDGRCEFRKLWWVPFRKIWQVEAGLIPACSQSGAAAFEEPFAP